MDIVNIGGSYSPLCYDTGENILSNVHVWSVCYESVIIVCLPSLILPEPVSAAERDIIDGRSEYRDGCW